MSSPLILVTPCQQAAGSEFADASISLSNRYTQAINHAGGVPLVLPVTATRDQIAELVRRADGVLLTGGEDIELKRRMDGLILVDRVDANDAAGTVLSIEQPVGFGE